MAFRNLLERQRNILDYSLQNLYRRKEKTLFILVIFVLLISVISSILFITGSLTREMLSTVSELPEITVQKIQGGRQTNISATYLSEIESIPGVEAVDPRVWGYFYLESLEANFTIFGFDLDTLEESDYEKLITENPKFASGKESNNIFKMVVGPGVYRLFKKIAMDDTFLFFNPNWGKSIPIDIIGIFKPETELQSVDLMLVQTEAARKILELPTGQYTDLAVYVSNPEEIENIARKIKLHYPELRTITQSQIQSTYSSVFGWRSGLVLSGLLVVIAAYLVLIWDRAGGLSQEERKEIGILKAIGWDTDMILSVKFIEGLILSLMSTILGILLSYIHIYWFDAVGLREVFIGWSTVYPSFKLVPHIDLKYIMLILTIAVVPYCAVSIVPAWKAAITDPDKIIRNGN